MTVAREASAVEAPSAAREHASVASWRKRKFGFHPQQRRHLRATREGKVFVFVTIGLGFAAVNTGTNLMYLVFGFMLSLIVVSGVLSEYTLRQLRVRRVLPSRVFAEQPALIEIAIDNDKPRITSYSVEVEDHAIAQPNERRCYFLKVAARSSQSASYRRVVAQRGRVRFSELKVSTRFPFALFEKWRVLASEDELVVFPRRRPVVLPKGAFSERGDGASSARGRGTETRELRDYREGDEARSLHWKRTAALGRPIARELERDASPTVSLRVDNLVLPGDPEASARFERAIEKAAYLVELALARGLSVEVCARGTRSPLLAEGVAPDPAWSFLALLEASTEPRGFAPATAHAIVVDVDALAEGGVAP